MLQVMPNSATSKGHRPGQADQAMRGRHVGGLERRGGQAVRRGDAADAAEAPRLHLGHDRLDEVERERHVDRDDRFPLRLGKLLDWCDVLDAGVVDDDVDFAEPGAGKLGHGAYLLGLAPVGARVTPLHAVSPLQLGARELVSQQFFDPFNHDLFSVDAERSSGARPASRVGISSLTVG